MQKYPYEISIPIKVKQEWTGPRTYTNNYKFYHSDARFNSDDYEERSMTADLPRNCTAKVSHGDQTFLLLARDFPPYILFRELKDNTNSYTDNAFAAWSMIKERIRNPKTEEEE